MCIQAGVSDWEIDDRSISSLLMHILAHEKREYNNFSMLRLIAFNSMMFGNVDVKKAPRSPQEYLPHSMDEEVKECNGQDAYKMLREYKKLKNAS